VIYWRALDEGLLPGRSIEGVATAAVYAASRQTGLPHTIDDVETDGDATVLAEAAA
jgi:transcription initiation factor TFIIB